jgi:adenylate kinase family enzyme
VPLLRTDDPLPQKPRRVLVAGPSGSGKTSLAARIGEVLDIRHVEIDGLFHGPDWQPRATFEEDVRAFSAEPAWVTEWQYDAVRPLLAERADLLAWLDLPRYVVMRQVVRRTVRRRLRREVLWNGNQEPPFRTIFTDPEHIVRWAWTTHHRSPERVRTLLAERPDLVVVRIRSHEEARRWLAGPLTRSRTGEPDEASEDRPSAGHRDPGA